MQKKISIIVPVYNGIDYINNLISNLESFNDDIKDEIEIILINDGSTDNSLDICKELEEQYPNIRVYDKKNGGIASARNYGLEKASGKYIAFVDQDDKLSRGYSRYLRALDDNDADILITDEVYNKPDGIERRGYVKEDEICDANRIKMLVRTLLNIEDQSVFSTYNCCPPTIWNCILRRELIANNNIKLFSFVDYEDDWLFLINSLVKSNKVVFSKDPFYLWTINDSSHSHTRRYIPNLESKLCKLNDFILSIMRNLDVTNDIMEMKRLQFYRECIINIFYNATYTSYSNFKNEVSSIMNKCYSENLIDKGNLSKGIVLQNIYLKLFAYKLFFIPYIMNRYFLKKRYH